MEFLKIFKDMRQLFEPYSDEERGRLFGAMMDYCFDGTEPSLDGNERYIWPVLRRHIDNCAFVASQNALNGQKGGRPKNQTKAKETEENRTKPNETEKKRPKPKETLQEQEQEHEQEQEQEQLISAHAREKTAAAVIGIDGSDLREDIARQQVADGLILRYRLGRDDRTREALLHDLAEYGEARIREVLDKAADSNTRGQISINYWRAILTGKARDKPGEYQKREYGAEHWDGIETKLWLDPDITV